MAGRCGRFGQGMAWFCLLVFTGCVPARHSPKSTDGPESPPVKTAVQAPAAVAAKSAPLPPSVPEPKGYRLAGDDPLVAERISLFEQKKNDWDETGKRLAALGAEGARPESWPDCQQDIEQALAGYRRLQTGQDRDLNPWEIMGRDMHYFTKDCDQVLVTAQTQGAGVQTPAAAVVQGSGNEQLRQYLAAGQYQEAVNAYEGLAKGQDSPRLSRADKFFYSRALVKLGRFQEAVGVLTELLREAGPLTDLETFEVRVLTADVLLATGQVDESRQVYAGLAKVLAPVVSQQAWAAAHAQALSQPAKDEDMELYRQMIQAYLQFDGQRVPQPITDGVAKLQGQAAGPLPDLARLLQVKAQEQSQAWARSQLTEIRALIDSHDLEKARALAEQVLATAPAEEVKAALTQLQAEIARGELTAKETPEAAGPPPLTPWEEALHLFEQQKYDEAITALQGFVDGEHGAEATAKMAEAAELAAAAMRRQAAALYAKARKTFDPEAKRQALLSSRSLLVTLIARYPATSIIDKARQNLKVLEGELGAEGASPAPLPAPADGGQVDRP